MKRQVSPLGKVSQTLGEQLKNQIEEFINTTLPTGFIDTGAYRVSGSMINNTMRKSSDVDIVLLSTVPIDYDYVYRESLFYFQDHLEYPGVDLSIVYYDSSNNTWRMPEDIIDQAISVFSERGGGDVNISEAFEKHIFDKSFITVFSKVFINEILIYTYHSLNHYHEHWKYSLGGARTQTLTINIYKILSRLGVTHYTNDINKLQKELDCLNRERESGIKSAQSDIDKRISRFKDVISELSQKALDSNVDVWLGKLFDNDSEYIRNSNNLPTVFSDFRSVIDKFDEDSLSSFNRDVDMEVKGSSYLYGIALNDRTCHKILQYLYFEFCEWKYRNLRDQVLKNINVPADILFDASNSISDFSSKRAKKNLDTDEYEVEVLAINQYFNIGKDKIRVRKRDETYVVRDIALPSSTFLAPYGTVHKHGLIHKTADVFLLDKTGDNILLVASDSKELQEHYTLPGGHVSNIHTSRDTAIKEVKEEVGVTLAEKSLLFAGKYLNYYRKIILKDDTTLVSFEPGGELYVETLDSDGIKNVTPYVGDLEIPEGRNIFFNQEICYYYYVRMDIHNWNLALENPEHNTHVMMLRDFKQYILTNKYTSDTYYVLNKHNVAGRINKCRYL